jgi:hypothetical protein
MIVIMMHHLGMTSSQQLVDTCHWLAYVSVLLAETENHANPHCGCICAHAVPCNVQARPTPPPTALAPTLWEVLAALPSPVMAW